MRKRKGRYHKRIDRRAFPIQLWEPKTLPQDSARVSARLVQADDRAHYGHSTPRRGAV